MSHQIAVKDLRVGMYVMLDGSWLSHPFLRSNFRIRSNAQLQALQRMGLSHVRWSPERSALPVLPVLPTAEFIEPPTAQPETTPTEDGTLCEREHAQAAQAWRAALSHAADQPPEAARQAAHIVQGLLNKIAVDQDVAIRLVAGLEDREAAHALNVAVISLLIGRTVGLATDEMLDMGVGALLHDVGKLDVAERYRHAEARFKTHEMHAYRGHVAAGAAIGQRMGLSRGALEVLTQHHEHADGSGFPRQLAGDGISLAAQIVALGNTYDNLCNPRSSAPPLTPHEALQRLFTQARHRFDATLLNVFIRMMGVYPAGSLVQLTDDRFALVVGVNANRPLKPRVLVHDRRVPRHEAQVVDLKSRLHLGIRRSVSAHQLSDAALEYLNPDPRIGYFVEPASHAPRDDSHGDQRIAA